MCACLVGLVTRTNFNAPFVVASADERFNMNSDFSVQKRLTRSEQTFETEHRMPKDAVRIRNPDENARAQLYSFAEKN